MYRCVCLHDDATEHMDVRHLVLLYLLLEDALQVHI